MVLFCRGSEVQTQQSPVTARRPWAGWGSVDLGSNPSWLCIAFVIGHSVFNLPQTVYLYSGQNETHHRVRVFRGVQAAARGPHAAQAGCERGPTQNRKCT